MTDYTPTTEQVRETYAALCKTVAAVAEFDRWLADVIRKAQEQAWQQGHGDPCDTYTSGVMCRKYHPNPYTEEP